MTDLINKKSVPHDRIKLLSAEEIKSYLLQLKNWEFLPARHNAAALGGESGKIIKEFKFEDFVKAMEFVNKVAAIAESEGHHPDIAISYDKVEITLWTHFVNGLSENDFIIAAKIDDVIGG